jgi:hypothetical protein
MGVSDGRHSSYAHAWATEKAVAVGQEPARSETSTLLNFGGEYLAPWPVRHAGRRGLFLRSRGRRAALAGQAFFTPVPPAPSTRGESSRYVCRALEALTLILNPRNEAKQVPVHASYWSACPGVQSGVTTSWASRSPEMARHEHGGAPGYPLGLPAPSLCAGEAVLHGNHGM